MPDLESLSVEEFEAIVLDAQRYRKMRDRGCCNEKSSAGFVIAESRLRAIAAFRYWCTPEKLDQLIDKE